MLIATTTRLPTWTPRRHVASRATATFKGLVGTVPHHNGYLLLHHPSPPSEYPPRFDSALHKTLQARVTRWRTLVNFSWQADRSLAVGSTSTQGSYDEEGYPATLYTAMGTRVDIPRLSASNIDDVEKMLKPHLDVSMEGSEATITDQEISLFVCTHGSRDCRCGNAGPAVVKTLKDEICKRSVSLSVSDPRRRVLERIIIGEVGHVGGHKYAANVLVFPRGDWLGYVTPEIIPALLDGIIANSALHTMPIISEHWRGRMGLAKEEQVAAYK
ncbi:hypothetical protein BD410DRAFT_747139, partial [Rickenella mellea]